MISIVTITYNNPEELKASINSVPAAGYIEHIIVNGGNGVYETDILEGRQGKIINEPDSGIADAFNKGIKHSSGTAVMFLNSGDVLLEPEYIGRSLELLNENPAADFIHSNILFIDTLGAALLMKPAMKNIGRGMPYLHPAMIVRRKVFDQIGLFNTSYKISMDYDFVVRMEKNGKHGMYVDGPPVVKMDGTGKSAAREYEAIIECFRSLKENRCITPANLTGYIIRVKLFAFRKALLKLGGGSILKFLKKKKYSK